ncbi:MAG: GGDEF domain-containing protein [Lachnospiraceae bacterium]|nr:GGDEF domain-containing protein [Lachnospiraceae bacterium]
MDMTVELFDSIINTSQDCVFWKDKDRRFLGVNQAFLDYYGFESEQVLIGKTDEDMGWHSDPEPFRQDELRVLSGKSTYKVQGKCIMRGEERDIIASKRPLYEDGRIVGLVGSFVDITDVIRRKEGVDRTQLVYTIDKLRKFRFFDGIIDGISLDEILDPLTGILNRAYSMRFLRSLIKERVPFSFAMIDLDNFKYINDTFGHSAGDSVLARVSKSLAEAAEGYGLVGRFGGDELLLIDLKNIKADERIAFFEKAYGDPTVLRSEMEFGSGNAFITATTGSAAFPEDADNFTDLFGIVDKMLYLGKSNGRNCFTVYEKEKHQNVEIRKIAKNGMFTEMHGMRLALDKEEGFENKLRAAMPGLAEVLQIRDLYYVREDGRMKAVLDPGFDEDASDIEKLMTEDIFSEAATERIEKEAPVFWEALKKKGCSSVLAARVRDGEKVSAYLVCAVERRHRIWQENECAILYYLAGLLA